MMRGTELMCSEILQTIGWFRNDTHFCSLNLTKEQWEVLNEATLSKTSDISTEEMIARALRTNKELYAALNALLTIWNMAADGNNPFPSDVKRIVDQVYAAINVADEAGTQ